MTTMRPLSRLARQAGLALKSALCSIAVLGLLVTTTAAQIKGRQTFHVPFGFVVGKTYCPAGNYTVKTMSPGTLAIVSADNSRNILFLAQPESCRKTDDRALLVFNRYGDRRYLSQIRPSDETTFLKVRRSQGEREVAKSWTERQETVVASAAAKE